jgi:hypothetical protein
MPPRDSNPSSRYDSIRADDLVVEYPPVTPGGRRSGGVSAVGAFFVAILAQVFTLGGVAGLAIAFPAQTAQIIAEARMLVVREVPERSVLSSRSPEPAAGQERMTILRLEDRAISRRDRQAWEELQARLARIPSSTPDYEAVQASLIRIQLAYQNLESAVPPPLEPREIFPTAATEAEIPLASLIQVLRDGKQSELKRQRCAFLLQKDPSTAARSALFQTIQEDPSLLVAGQAFHSFRALTGYPDTNCFDSQAVARWWSRNAHGAVGQN